MFLFFGFGVICWLVYGLGLGSVPMIVANAVPLAQVLVILALKLRYDGHSKQWSVVRQMLHISCRNSDVISGERICSHRLKNCSLITDHCKLDS